jgi:hypothetical protein
MVWPDNIDSGRSNSQLGDRSRCCRHCNLVHLLSIHSLKRASDSSTDQGGRKRWRRSRRARSQRRKSHRAFLRDATTRSSLRCPLYPQKRTLELNREMSALCQKQPHALHHPAIWNCHSKAPACYPTTLRRGDDRTSALRAILSPNSGVSRRL